jgi:hypothetical protein
VGGLKLQNKEANRFSGNNRRRGGQCKMARAPVRGLLGFRRLGLAGWKSSPFLFKTFSYYYFLFVLKPIYK